MLGWPFPLLSIVGGGGGGVLGPMPEFVVLTAGSSISWVGLCLLLHICPQTQSTHVLGLENVPKGCTVG